MKSLLESAEYFLDDGSELLPRHITESKLRTMISRFKKCGFVLTESEFRKVAIHALGGDSILTEWNQDDLLIDTIRSYVFGSGDKTPHTEVKEEGLAASQAFFEAIINIAKIDKFEIFEKEGVEHFFTKNSRPGSNSKDAFLDFMFVVQKESHGDFAVVVKNIERCLSAVNKMVEKYSNGVVVSVTSVPKKNEKGLEVGTVVTPGSMNKLITDKIRVHLEKISKDKTIDQRQNAKILAKALEEIQAVKELKKEGDQTVPVKNVKSYLSIFGRLLTCIEELHKDKRFDAMFDVFLDRK